MTKVVCWNMGYKRESWRRLVRMGADVALLQEPCRVPREIADRVEIEPRNHWEAWDSCHSPEKNLRPHSPTGDRGSRSCPRSREGGLVQAGSPA